MVGCLKDCAPDVVFAQCPYMYSRAALLSGFPTLVVGRDSPWRVARLMRSFRMWHRAVYSKVFVAPKLKHLTTISPHMVGDLKAWWGRSAGEISVIPNAIPDGVATEIPKRVIDVGSTIACVTDWNELKNAKTLLRAFACLRTRHPDWRLVVYGNSMLPDGAAGEWMQKNGIKLEGVDLRGYGRQEEVRTFLFREADVFCSPTLEESFGQVFLEAMAQGVPCVGGEKSGAVPWVMGDAGVLCDVTSPEELARCLERVMLDCDLRKRLSLNGIKRVRTDFSMNLVIGQYERALAEVATCK